MKLPNGDQAFVDSSKLEEYCLNEHHPRGRHKARLFAAFGSTDFFILKSALLEAAASETATIGRQDHYGTLYNIFFKLNSATIKSIWIIRTEEIFPRLVTCFILKSNLL